MLHWTALMMTAKVKFCPYLTYIDFADVLRSYPSVLPQEVCTEKKNIESWTEFRNRCNLGRGCYAGVF